MKRAVELCPSLTGGKGPEALNVIRHCVGLRPLREGGTRLEKEKMGDMWVVHNYAHGGFGCKSFLTVIVIDFFWLILNRSMLIRLWSCSREPSQRHLRLGIRSQAELTI